MEITIKYADGEVKRTSDLSEIWRDIKLGEGDTAVVAMSDEDGAETAMMDAYAGTDWPADEARRAVQGLIREWE